jgi:glycosyltransferase involved in cell wall biosynthesis
VTEEHPLVSVIVSSYTMERFNDLCELLGSLERQTFRNFETLLVLEKSRELYDRVDAYVKQNKYDNVQLLFNSGTGGLSAARNLGVKEATGKIMAFIDDDALAFPGWLAAMVHTYKDASVIGFTGPALPLWENEKLSWIPEEFYWIVSCMSVKSDSPVEVRNAWGTNMSFRKAAFEQCGAFAVHLGAKGGGTEGKNELIGEDTEFSMRVREKTGRKIIYNPEGQVRHRAYSYRLKWAFIAKRAYWEGYTKAIFKRQLQSSNTPNILGPERTLLKQIMLHLIPSTVFGLIKQPVISWKRLQLTLTVLTFVTLGYFGGMLHHLTVMEVTPCPASS